MSDVKADIFVLCDHASISQEQKLSIIGVFDNFFVSNIPAVWPRMYLVAVLKGEPDKEYNLKLKIVPPKGVQASFPEKELTLKFGPGGKTNFMTEMINFQLPAPGKYKIQLSSAAKTVGDLEFTVTKRTNDFGSDLAGKKISN